MLLQFHKLLHSLSFLRSPELLQSDRLSFEKVDLQKSGLQKKHPDNSSDKSTSDKSTSDKSTPDNSTPEKGIPDKNSGHFCVSLLISLCVITLPAFLLYTLIRDDALQTLKQQALSHADSVLIRSETAADQVYAAVDLLAAQPGSPCSAGHLRLMRQIQLESSLLKSVGYISDNQLLCSSQGVHFPGIDVGPVDIHTSTGSALRTGVRLGYQGRTGYQGQTGEQGRTFNIVERKGYAVIGRSDVSIDIFSAQSDVALATFTPDNAQLRSRQGPVEERWVTQALDEGGNFFIDNGFLVARVLSDRYATGAIAAVPLAAMTQQLQQLGLILFPVVLLAGVVLALIVRLFLNRQLGLPAMIRTALRYNEFFLCYQPIVDLRTGLWCGVEVLIRWQRPNGELISPDTFIPVAEQSGLIKDITGRVLELAAEDLAPLIQACPDFHIGFNLSADDLHTSLTVHRLRNFIHSTGANPASLMVEATERGFVDAEQALQVLKEIRSLGVCVAIDDFGTGYSGLAYLESLHLDYLKIDKSFVDTIGTEAATSQVVFHIIQMSKSMGYKMIAEGVETEEQAAVLRQQGVCYAQGWLYARPLPAVDLLHALQIGDAPSSPAPQGVVETGLLQQKAL